MALCRRHAEYVFKSKDLVVRETLHLEDLSETTPGHSLEDFVVERRVCFLDLDGFSDVAGDLLVRSQTLDLLPLLVQHHLEADEGVLGLCAEIEVLHVLISSSRQACPVD